MRLWHRWIGVAAALFLLVFAITGIVLNYKQPILGTLGLWARETPAAISLQPQALSTAGAAAQVHGPLSARAVLRDLPIPLEQALAHAEQQWGTAALERIELKLEHGRWRWKLKEATGAELMIDAHTGQLATRGRYEKWATPDARGQPARSTDWGKILLDLHTGRIAGPWGKAIMTAAAGLLLFLTLSGLYLWCKPLWLGWTRTKSRLSVAASRSTGRPQAVETSFTP